MLKTKFSLTSVVTLTGLVIALSASACGSNDEEETGTTAGATDPGARENPPGASGDGGGNTGKTPTPGCPTEDAIDATKLPWKPPTIAAGACTQAELDGLVSFVDSNASAKYNDWKTSVTNSKCRDCIFSKDGATWSPMVETSAGELAVMNVGGCIGITTGNRECGKSYQNWVDCRLKACGGCDAGDLTALQKCLTISNGGSCKEASSAVSTVCGDKVIADAEAACEGKKYIFEGPVRAQCVGGAPTK